MSEIADLDRRVLWHPFTQMAEWEPLVIARGEGCFLFDEDGRRYLDGVSSLWCNLHGHNHPALNAAASAQLARLAHSTFLGLTHEPGVRLAAALVEALPTGLRRVFYSDSGSTAVEVALKQSYQYWQLMGATSKRRFVRLEHAYHGDTLGAVGVGGIEVFHRVFGPILVESIGVASPDRGDAGAASLAALERLFEERSTEIAALVMEPLIQGAAGMIVHPPGFLRAAAALCQEFGVHLIVDEVATGFGRTGTLFAIEQEEVVPDFVCLAKGLAGGYLPLAATVTTEEVYAAFLGKRAEMKHFFHGHTFTANPLACAVGIASLELLEGSTLPNARFRVPQLAAALASVASHPGVLETRQVGMMAGIEVAPIPGRFAGVEVCEAARRHGVLLRPLGDVVVWMPPLVVGEAELALLAQATLAAISEVLG